MRSPPTLSRAFPPYSERQRQAQLSEARSHAKEHGRIVTRHLQASTRLAGVLDWPGLAQTCRLERTTKRGGETTVEVQYSVTSAPRHLADATQLLPWWRGHWGIENRLHWVRDTAFGEDRCRIRTGTAPHVFSIFRNAAVNLLRAMQVPNITAALRQNAYRVDRLLAMLGILKE